MVSLATWVLDEVRIDEYSRQAHQIPRPTSAWVSNALLLCLNRSGLHSLDAELLRADQVRNMVYRVMQDACSRPEDGWASWTLGRIEQTVSTIDSSMLMVTKNFCDVQPVRP